MSNRNEIAARAMQGILSNDTLMTQIRAGFIEIASQNTKDDEQENLKKINTAVQRAVAGLSVKYADELIEALEGKGVHAHQAKKG